MRGNQKQIPISVRDRVIEEWLGDENGHKSLGNVAKILSMNKGTIQKIVEKFQSTGSVLDLPRSGRPQICSPREKKSIVRMVKKAPKSTAQEIATQSMVDTGKSVSRFTIRRILKNDGFRCCRARNKPLINLKNRQKRLEFARRYIKEPDTFWESVLVSDECRFPIFSDGPQNVYRQKSQALLPRNLNPTVKQGGGGVNAWGCMSYSGVGSMEFIDGIMDTAVYQGIVERNVKQSATKLGLGRRFIFQQDNDPKHAKLMRSDFFKKNKIKVLDWPSQSPDLNPIEHLWQHMKRKLREKPNRNKSGLKTNIREIWSAIDPEVTKKLMGSMKHRLQEVIASRGYPTSY